MVRTALVDFFDVAAWSAKLTEALAEPKKFDPLRARARETALNRYDMRKICLPKMVEYVESLGPKAAV